MEWLEVKNWQKYQHYKDRCPPWIKLHVSVLNDRKFSALSCASKGLLMQLWILASESDGKVPYDLTEIQFRLRDDTIKIKDVNLLITKGFFKNCKQTLADAVPETETETETETENIYRSFFDSFWIKYPRKIKKDKCITKWEYIFKGKANSKAEALNQEITIGLDKYITYWTDNNTETEFIPHPLTWLNGKQWEDELVGNDNAFYEKQTRDFLERHKNDKEE